MKTMSVIIVTYNSQDLIEKCLTHLFLHNDIGNDLEVVIVDNSSEEVSKEMFAFIEMKFPNQVKLIKNDKNGGYGQGNNLGVIHASGDYIAIMNPDITMTEPLFLDALRNLQSDEQLGILGYKQMGGYNLSFYIRREFFIPVLILFLTKILNRLNIFSSRFMFVSGAYFFMSKKSFERIGFFDENLFLYCEESDITQRMLKSGLKIKYDKNKSYIHEIDQRTEMSDSSFKIMLESTLYYLEKFSFSKNNYVKKLLFELYFKKLVFTFLNKKETKNILSKQIKILKSFEVKQAEGN